LRNKGYSINILSRSRSGGSPGIRYFKWSVRDGIIENGALDADHIIHLAGAGVADKRWTTSRKKEILDSRILSTKLLQEKLVETERRPETIVCASAVGYYGDCRDDVLTESSPPGKGFLADVCSEWENSSTHLSQSAGSPVSIFRIGIVLSTRGGALPKLALPLKMGIGAYLGNGQQYYPWIHIDDLCNMMIYAMEKGMDGIYNASAPDPVTNKTLSKTVAHILKRPFIPLPAPAILLKASMGEMAEMLLNSQRTSAAKIIAAGFEFSHPGLEGALRDLYHRGL
jgi:uncharacterized protein (TIGR01777 family)